MKGSESLCIFHEDLGSTDETATTEEMAAKIMYYYPQETELEVQLSQLRFCEGILGFTDHFTNKEDDYYVVQTEKHTYAFFKCEMSIWIIVALEKVAMDENTNEESLKAVLHHLYNLIHLFYGSFSRQLDVNPTLLTTTTAINTSGKEILNKIKQLRKEIRKTKEKIERHHVHQEETCHLETQLVELQQQLEEYILQSPIPQLEQNLHSLIPRYLSTIDFSELHFFYDLEGFQQFPVEKTTVLDIYHFLHSIHLNVGKDLKHSSFFFDGHFIWSNFEPHLMNTIYNFLRLKEAQAIARTGHSSTWHQDYDSTFIWGTTSVPESYIPIWGSSIDIFPSAFLNRQRKSLGGLDTVGLSLGLEAPPLFYDHFETTSFGFCCKDYHYVRSTTDQTLLDKLWCPSVYNHEHLQKLVVFQICRITLVFLIDVNADLSTLCTQLEDNILRSDVHHLAKTLFHIYLQRNKQTKPSYSSIYYNHSNLALQVMGITGGARHTEEGRFPIHLRTLSFSLPETILNTLDNFHSTFQRGRGGRDEMGGKGGISELCVKTANDGWIAGRAHANRELYVLVDNKIPSLVGTLDFVEEVIKESLGNLVV